MKKLLCLLFFAALCARATMIQWFVDPRSENFTEEGADLDQSFRFELGVFANGFVPTEENIDQWSENWVAAQRATYHEGNRWFTSVYHVTENTAPFTVNTPAYVWGFSGGPDEGEWVLFRGASWRWPRASFNPNPRVWNAREATEVIMGSVGVHGEVIRTARVRGKVPPITTWLQWLEENNQSAEAASVMEYATGSPYAALGMVRNENGDFELIVPRRADRPANFQIEVTEDLANPDWRPAGELTELVRQDHTRLVFGKGPLKDLEPGQLFFRFKVSVQE